MVFNRLALLMVMMFAIQIASSALFYHTHTIDGKIYSHAHPGCDGHSHNSTDFIFYQQLQTILSEDLPTLLSEVLPIYIEVHTCKSTLNLITRHIHHCAGRAPPTT